MIPLLLLPLYLLPESEAVLDEIADSPERDFLAEYSCVNGVELSSLADRAGFVDDLELIPPTAPPAPQSCDPKTIQALQRFIDALPVKLGDLSATLPELCNAAVGLLSNFKK
jgi:hypothetical protein